MILVSVHERGGRFLCTMTKDDYSVQCDGVSFLAALARAYLKLTARRLAAVFGGPSRIHRRSP